MGLMIAATARTHGLTLFTRDAELVPLADQLDLVRVPAD